MNTENTENLIALLRSDDHFSQGLELCQALELSADTVLDKLGFLIELTQIPGGASKIGEEGHQEEVHFEEFEMAVTMTTGAQWAAIMGWVFTGTTRRAATEDDFADQRPVVNVTAHEVQEFCRRLTAIYSLDDSPIEVRLPHSAEWEHAARGGENYKYAGSDDPDEVAWYAGNSDYKLKPVGLKKPNGFGLYDMSGNAYCWTATEWDPDDPSGAAAYRLWIEENGA